MTADLQRCRDEQARCATLLLAGHAEQHGLRMGLTDWFMEELILEYPSLWSSGESGGASARACASQSEAPPAASPEVTSA